MSQIESIQLTADTRSVFVYLIDRCCLVNTGPSSLRPQLEQQLAERNVAVDQIKRIAYTDWNADTFGNQDLFPRAHHFHVGSISSITTFVAAENARLEALAEAVGASTTSERINPPIDGFELKDGIRVALGKTIFEAVQTPGITPGSVSFHSPAHTFIGAIPTFGFPDATGDAESYLTSLDRLRALSLKTIHPLYDEQQTRGDWVIKRVQETTQMLLSTIGTKVEAGEDIVACIERAFGIEIDSVDTLYQQLCRYGPFIEPFVQADVA